MSLFSVGGGLGFALAPAAQDRGRHLGNPRVALPLGTNRNHRRPACPNDRLGAAKSQNHHGDGPNLKGRDDWRAFGVLSGATICRSIVFYGLNTFLGLYFMAQWHQTADQGSRASVVFLGTSIFGTLLGGWLADRFGRIAVIRKDSPEPRYSWPVPANQRPGPGRPAF